MAYDGRAGEITTIEKHEKIPCYKKPKLVSNSMMEAKRTAATVQPR